ncbi:MAG TPA: fibronectin type III domain-containing protein, partial [Patescibacteria group bacterium]|nr:fibronectin type III domain-containing protein [Patescibacteria group bacterium]
MKKRLSRCFRLLLTFLLVFSWLFASWPVVWENPRIPPQLNQAEALNKLDNSGFASALGAEWHVDAGSNSAAENTYGRVSDGSSQDGDGYDFKGQWTGGKNNQNWTKCIWQTFTPAVNVKAKLRGYYKRIVVGALDSNEVKLELLTGVSSCTDGSVVATAFDDTGLVNDASWQGGSWTSTASLTGGTTYYVRIYWKGVADSGESGGGIVDAIQLNVSPASLSASTPVETTNISLSWTASTAGTGAPGLNATTPYKVYRDGSSPVSTFLANASTNSYADSLTTGNTTYYYAVSDLDTNSLESPLSAEATILTLPGIPGTPTFSDVTGTSITVSWSAPMGGAGSYKVDRAPDSGGSPGSWSEVGSGVTSPWTNNTGLSCNITYWYRVRGTNATGDGAYSGQASQTTGACGVSISLDSDGTVTFGLLGVGSSADTTPSGKNDVEVISV